MTKAMAATNTSTLYALLLLCVSVSDGGVGSEAPSETGAVEEDMSSTQGSVSVAAPGKVSATEPYIDPSTPKFVKAYEGTPAIIPCFVNNLGQRSLSWVRHRDIHVLTVGRFTFTNDDRFEAHHEEGSNEWILRLRSPSSADSGIYECQVNTKPTITQLITLKVIEPRATITPDGPELYLDKGSQLRLSCQVADTARPPEFLIWYHKQQVASFGEDVEIKIDNEENVTTSTLTLQNTREKHSGIYTCSPSNAKEASIRVHVLSGEHPAAMQTNSGTHMIVQQFIMWISLYVGLLGLQNHLIFSSPLLHLGYSGFLNIYWLPRVES